MNARLAQEMFDATADSPGEWLFAGHSLKVASDQLTSQTSEDFEQIPLVHLQRIRKMLQGLAFEMILKGATVMEGRTLVAKHGLVKLFREIDPAKINATARDEDFRSYGADSPSIKRLPMPF